MNKSKSEETTMQANVEQLKQVLNDVKALGFNLSDASDKSDVYSHIACNDSSYELSDGTVIEHISIKYLFWLYNNQNKGGRLKPKA
jgi:hypothetical protein